MKHLRKAVFNFFVDGVSLMVLMAMVATGLTMQFRLLPGSKGGQGWTIWGFSRHDWGAIHFYLALAFLALMALHVFLHWRWVWAIVTGHDRQGASRRRVAFLLVTLASLLMAGLPWLMPVDRSGEGEGERREGGVNLSRGGEVVLPGGSEAGSLAQVAGEAASLRGSATLAEAAALTGMDLPTLLQRLGLPADTSPNERLGRAMRSIGLTMTDARERLGLPDEDH